MKPYKKQVFIAHPHPIIYIELEILVNGQEDLHVCGTSRDYDDALNSIRKLKPDVAVVDIYKNNKGKCIVADVRKENHSLPVLVVSAFNESLYAQRCLRKGANGYITLDKNEDEILKAIRLVLAGETYLSEEELQKVLSSYKPKGSILFNDPTTILSERESQVYLLSGQGRTTKQIAENMGISPKTIDTYYDKIKKKLGFVNIHEMRKAASFLFHREAV